MDWDKISRMPYLWAIQKVPGDSAGEKLSWISRCVHQQVGETQLPPELLSLYRVEVAVKTENYVDVISALKSEDILVINRALKATWLFDGSYKIIIDDAYFVEHIFPYVPVSTRKRIVNALAYRTIGRDPEFAQRMFTAVVSLYGIQAAYPLLLASGEKFAYKTIVEKEYALPCGIIKKMWRAYPDLVIRYFKLLPPRSLDDDRLLKPFGVTIHKYKSFLPSLAKKRTKDFVELCEKNRRSLPRIKLSNTAARVFLKKGQSYFVKNPQLFIDMLPYEKINVELMKTIFPSLLPEEKCDFDTDRMLEYLKCFPKDKKLQLLYKAYKIAYGTELVSDRKNVTFTLLRLLPAEERIDLARSAIENNTRRYHKTENQYESFICYLPTNQVIPAIKQKIDSTEYCKDNCKVYNCTNCYIIQHDIPSLAEKHNYILQMFYNCKINNDNVALADVLVYYLQHIHRDFKQYDTMAHIYQFFDVPRLSKDICHSIFNIVQWNFMKYRSINAKLVEALVHHRLIHNMPITDLIMIMINSKIDSNSSICFNILKNCPVYERKWLVTFLEFMEEKCKREKKWDKGTHLTNLLETMYDFNDRCEKSKTKIKRLTIMDYPWLIDRIRATIVQSQITWNYRYWNIKTLLKREEPKLHDEWFSSVKIIMDVTSSELLRLLRQNPDSIVNDWKGYFKQCEGNWCDKRVQRFVKIIRWHKHIPIAFAMNCLRILKNKRTMSKNLQEFATVMLSLLLHGDSLTKLTGALLPAKTTINAMDPDMQEEYSFVQHLCRSVKLSNPPVPLDLVASICREDYLPIALQLATSIGKRSSIAKVKAFAQNLQDVHARKYGITMMRSITSVCQQIDFFQEMWMTEKQNSVREALFKNVHELFVKFPTPETWNLYAGAILTLNKDQDGLFKPVCEIPQKYIGKYLKVWFGMLDKIEYGQNTVASYLKSLEEPNVRDVLSEELIENVLERFLFSEDTHRGCFTVTDKIREKMKHFAIACLSSNDQNKLAPRIKMIMNVILNAVRNRRNVYPPNSCGHPVNTTVRELIFDLVFYSAVDIQVINNVLTLFPSVLSPVQFAESYLLLTYAKILKKNCTLREIRDFGLKLGQQITDIINFSPLLIPFMADVLDHFLMSCVVNWITDFDKDTRQPTENEAICQQLEEQPKPVGFASLINEIQFNIIEGLAEARNSYSHFLAVTILSRYKGFEKYEERYNKLIEKFCQMHEDPTMTILYKYFDNYIHESQSYQNDEKSSSYKETDVSKTDLSDDDDLVTDLSDDDDLVIDNFVML